MLLKTKPTIDDIREIQDRLHSMGRKRLESGDYVDVMTLSKASGYLGAVVSWLEKNLYP